MAPAIFAAGCRQASAVGRSRTHSDSGVRVASNSPAVGCVITPESMGPVRLGMKLGEVKAAVADASFERSTDGDGAVFVDMKRAGREFLTLFANEADETAPIDWTRRVVHIEAFTPECRTHEGVGVGSPVVEVEKLYGKVTKIELSEIESREFITFTRHPEGLVFRLDYTGQFDGDSRVTTKYAPGGKIFSISIHRRE